MAKVKKHSDNLLERIRVKGEDFDVDGQKTPKNELFKMEGLFKLTEVQDRIPFDNNRLKYWHSDPKSPYYTCFKKLPLGIKRNLVLVDLIALSEKIDEQMLKSPTSHSKGE